MFACLMIIAVRVIKKSYYVDRSNNFKLPKFHPKCIYNINAVEKRLCLCIGLS